MEVLNYMAPAEYKRLTAKILRSMERLVCRHRNLLPNGWRAIIELQRKGEKEPYFALDVQGNAGGADLALTKMQMLKLFDNLSHTGGMSLPSLLELAKSDENIATTTSAVKMLSQAHSIKELSDAFWAAMQPHGFTRWYGAIRVPYEILAVVSTGGDDLCASPDDTHEEIVDRKGEIRISFSGAKELEDVMFAVWLFNDICSILNASWENDQIWWDLSKLREDPHIELWLDLLDTKEA